MDTKEAWSVHLKSGVKPKEIDRLGQLATKQKLNLKELQHLKQLEDEFTIQLLAANPANIFEIKRLDSFQWQPNTKADYPKTDIINKAAK